ncbi:MAG TPA: hypothetical protein PLO37_10705 [Candidatus Hydrogenedentes bacterium]|nr:hypothetical protein [Candidatus Hydrogenedentota bacterium]
MATKDYTCSRRTAMLTMMGAAGLAGSLAWSPQAGAETKGLQAGAHAIDITPQAFPVIVNGMFLERTAESAVEPIHARCLVLDDGTTRVAIAVIDNIGMSRQFLDAIKEQASQSTGIPVDHILISATHSHSTPSVEPLLGSGRDEAYTQFLPPRIVKGIEQAAANLEPARVGWAVAEAGAYTSCRRWIFRSDRVRTDPFGDTTVRANMHPGHLSPDAVGPSGPIDPDLTLLSVQARDGRPIAVLANFSMHYYGSPMVSPDYYGPFCAALARLIGAEQGAPPFVGMISHGTSGDQYWVDYSKEKYSWGDYHEYAEIMAKLAAEAYKSIAYHDDATVQMAERKVTFGRRVPDEARLAWARDILAPMGDRQPENQQEVYAREAVILHDEPTRELKLQAIRIGDMGITAIPNEVYAFTGLKLKALSPFDITMNIELANGCEGYIPPPEQHVLGGYNTWPARTAGLEVQAEPAIVDNLLDLLEEVSGRPRRAFSDPEGPYVQAVRASMPVAYWRLSDFTAERALDIAGQGRNGVYEDGVVFYLPGPEGAGLRGAGHTNRAAHFAGGRMTASVPDLGEAYSVEMWFWNGFPADARPVAGYLFSRGPGGVPACPGDHLGIGGTHTAQSKLLFFNGNERNEALAGTAEIAFKTWNHVVFIRDGQRVVVYLNGRPTAEIASTAEVSRPADAAELFIGGRSDNFANWEGKIAEVAVYNRALSADEAQRHYTAAAVSA